MKRVTWTILLASLLLAACSGTGAQGATPTPIPTVPADSSLLAEGRVEPVRYVDLALNASGLVSSVLSKEGDSVQAGQLIASLEGSDAQTLEQAQTRVSQQLNEAYQTFRDAQYSLDHFDVPSEFEGLTAAQAVSQALAKLNTARAAFEPYRYVFFGDRNVDLSLDDPAAYRYMSKRVNSDALEAKRSLDDAWASYRKAIQWLGLETDLESAQTAVDKAQKDYAALQDSSLGEDTAGLRASLASAEVRAPFAGTITNLDLKLGEYASAGQSELTLADFSSWVVKTTDLTELDVVNIKEGQTVTFTLDAVPGLKLHGVVQTISKNYTEKQGDITYVVTIAVKDPDPRLRWGMTAQVNFNR